MDLGDDDLWRLKMGRFSDAEERIIKGLFRQRKRRGSATLSGRALSWRTRHVEGGWRFNSGPQVVVKAAGSRKSRSGVRACVRYVSRLRRDDPEAVRTFDEFGRELAPAAVLKAVEAWQLDGDADNLSAAGRQADGVALGERQRLRHIQAWHFVFSVSADDDAQATGRLLRASAATIDQVFTRRGHRVLWALHTDCPGRPHVHAVVKAVSEFGGRLRCDIHGDLFDTLRCELASALSMTGLKFQAARREDRNDLRHKIMAGQEPLRPGRRRGRGDGDLVRRAPGWFGQFGSGYLDRMQRREEEPAPPVWRRWLQRLEAKPEPPPLPASLVEAHTAFARVYRDPRRALASWQWLAVEGARRLPNGTAVFPTRRLAEWYARHRPEVFGALLPGAQPDDGVRAVLRQVNLPVPPRALPPCADWEALHAFNRDRWRRRVVRDRQLVVRSLRRLAGIAFERGRDVHLVRQLLRRLDTVLDVPIGKMPVVEQGMPARPPVSGAVPPQKPTSPGSPAAALPTTEPQPSVPVPRPAPQRRSRPPRRGDVER